MSRVDDDSIKDILSSLDMLLIVEALSVQIVSKGHYNDSALRQKVLSDLRKDLLFETQKLFHLTHLLVNLLNILLKCFYQHTSLPLFKLLLYLDWHDFQVLHLKTPLPQFFAEFVLQTINFFINFFNESLNNVLSLESFD